jgi:hypothetical protein
MTKLIVMWLLVGLVGCAADATGGEGEPDGGPSLGGAVEGEPEPAPDAGACDCKTVWEDDDGTPCKIDETQACVPCSFSEVCVDR